MIIVQKENGNGNVKYYQYYYGINNKMTKTNSAAAGAPSRGAHPPTKVLAGEALGVAASSTMLSSVRLSDGHQTSAWMDISPLRSLSHYQNQLPLLMKCAYLFTVVCECVTLCVWVFTYLCTCVCWQLSL